MTPFVDRVLLDDHEVAFLRATGRVQRVERVSIDDAPITKAQAERLELQRGIPRNARNVRWLGSYLKCDAPDGSATVSSRVVPPYDDAELWVAEAYAEHEVDDVVGTRVFYRADYPDGRLELRPGVPVVWSGAAAMPRHLSRLLVRVKTLGARVVHGAWHWAVLLDSVHETRH